MSSGLRFLANDRVVEATAWAGSPAIDFIRRELALTGTKEGCREGDCGACAVLLGDRVGRTGCSARYRAVPSCLLALGELEGRHLVTIEGLCAAGSARSAGEYVRLTPVMRALVEENASQCGFCSPGLVISLTAFLLEGPPLTVEKALSAVEGNLCRCTGYGAIKRAAERLTGEFSALPMDSGSRLLALEEAGVIPLSLSAYSRGELLPFADEHGTDTHAPAGPRPLVLGGGTDYYVQNTDPHPTDSLLLLDRHDSRTRIELTGVGGDRGLEIGAAVTWRDFFFDPRVRALAPSLPEFEGRLASVLVRNRATVGGNVANASPVADLTVILIALGARIKLEGPGGSRELELEKFFQGYKQLDMRQGEIIASLWIPAAETVRLFNFEKVGKRAVRDIAAVNSAAAFRVEGVSITRARISAGGVAARPLLLEMTSSFLEGKMPSIETAREAARIAASEVTPIDDVRGSGAYRKRLLERLVLGHFVRLFPERVLVNGDRVAELLS
jgi:xanthine dehydrogenase small subunit